MCYWCAEMHLGFGCCPVHSSRAELAPWKAALAELSLATSSPAFVPFISLFSFPSYCWDHLSTASRK